MQQLPGASAGMGHARWRTAQLPIHSAHCAKTLQPSLLCRSTKRDVLLGLGSSAVWTANSRPATAAQPRAVPVPKRQLAQELAVSEVWKRKNCVFRNLLTAYALVGIKICLHARTPVYVHRKPDWGRGGAFVFTCYSKQVITRQVSQLSILAPWARDPLLPAH
jgi:hypothetical protein